jgi:hypothetical protein
MDADANGSHLQSNCFPANGGKNYFPIRKATVFPQTAASRGKPISLQTATNCRKTIS